MSGSLSLPDLVDPQRGRHGDGNSTNHFCGRLCVDEAPQCWSALLLLRMSWSVCFRARLPELRGDHWPFGSPNAR